jgi:hypothetical protein
MCSVFVEKYHRVQIVRDPMLGQQRASAFTLQRKEAEPIGRVVVNHKVHETTAQQANAVEEDDRRARRGASCWRPQEDDVDYDK